jgi:hypothetical protein
LSRSIERSESKRELEEKASRVYENNVLPGLEKLKAELSDQSIKSLWQGFYQGAMVSVGTGTALAKFTAASEPTVLGVGAFLAVATVGINAVIGRRKARRASPYTYLLDIESRFSMPRYT